MFKIAELIDIIDALEFHREAYAESDEEISMVERLDALISKFAEMLDEYSKA